MKKFTLIAALLIYSLTGFSVTWTVNSSGFTFSPSSVTIIVGDDVNFVLESIHNVVEVSQTTWNADGNTPLPGGFSLPLGGGLVTSSQLTVGTHWYVCSPHAFMGMKGIIIVTTSTGIKENKSQLSISLYPNPASDLITVKTTSGLLNFPYFITDGTGKQVLSGKITSEITNIEIGMLEKGIYLFQIPGQTRQSLKLIKK
jgi:plastocyanin